jgi:membrane dipeptidase
MKENGGVVFVNFYPGYIDSEYEEKAKVVKESFKLKSDSLAKLYDPNSDNYWYKESEMLLPHLQRVVPDLGDVVDHIEYIIDLIGVDHVGIGADWDGVGILPRGIDKISKLPDLTRELLERGYSERDVKKILGGNFKRVFKEVTS